MVMGQPMVDGATSATSPLDETGLPQGADAAVAGWGGKTDPVGQLRRGQTGILLQLGEDEQIKFVGHGVH